MKRLFRSTAAIVLVLLMLISSASALTVDEALEILETGYLREIPDEAYEAQTLEELFALLGDPYTYYMSREEYQGFMDSVESTVNLVGIGVSIQYTQDGILILSALKGGSAIEAGLRSGDLIIAVEGVSCVPAAESHRDMIRGEEGTEVTITVLRDGVAMDYTLKRTAVTIPNTEAEVVNGHIGYISCTSFGSDTGALFLECVETYNEAVDCWLIDMRGNSGGYTQAAVDSMGVFAGAGRHVYLRDGQGRLFYYGYGQDPATDYPAVILVDGNSASAAEAFAAGMRDLRGGLIIGSRTYGKGTAQVVLDHKTDPDLFKDDALKVTAYRFYSNGGITNDHVGVIPTLLVSDEVAYEIALAVCGKSADDPDHKLQLRVDGWDIELDYTAMSEGALAALLEAVPPNAYLAVYEDGLQVELTPAAAARRFGVEHNSRWLRDVEESRFATAINTMATYGVIDGDEEGNFYPEETLTRGEACALLGKALGLEGNGIQWFDDVTQENDNAPYINALAELGMVVGVGDGTFRPDAPVTQQEYITMLARAARYLNVNITLPTGGSYEDVLEAMGEMGFRSWAWESVLLLASLNALNTVSGETEPFAPVLREEAAANLCSVLIGTGVLPG